MIYRWLALVAWTLFLNCGCVVPLSPIPTRSPTASKGPTVRPTTRTPSVKPSLFPTYVYTKAPSMRPTQKPSHQPSVLPSSRPSAKPSRSPTSRPTSTPTRRPTSKPTATPQSASSISPDSYIDPGEITGIVFSLVAVIGVLIYCLREQWRRWKYYKLEKEYRNRAMYDGEQGVEIGSPMHQSEKLPSVNMLILYDDGEDEYANMTLRDLFTLVNAGVHAVDVRARSASRTSADGSSTPTAKFDGHRNVSNPVGDADESNYEHNTPSTVVELKLRDLRRLDFQFNPNEEKSVLIRRHAILIAIDPLRAVVMADKLILIVPDGADSLIGYLSKRMQDWYKTDGAGSSGRGKSAAFSQHTSSIGSSMDDANNEARSSTQSKVPFESHAYDALLTAMREYASEEFKVLSKGVHEVSVLRRNVMVLHAFRALEDRGRNRSLLPIEIQEQMRSRKNDLAVLLARVSSTRNVLLHLTEDEHQLALMNLSVLRTRPSLYAYPLVPEILATHEEVEELLESHCFDFNSLQSKIELLRNQVQSAEELVSLRLDTSRNELLIANTALSVLAASIGLGAYITGVFGMNLDNVIYLMPQHNSFVTVTLLTFAAIVFSFGGIISYLNFKGMLPNKTEIGDPYGTKNFEMLDNAFAKGWQAVSSNREQAIAKELGASFSASR